ncbi:hypothetical protein H6775_02590 [Candidatus Nomurabacteria bacterium]|nr:hypothetical protein [Candidatus Nomurabacteria bacterium]
MTNFWKIPSDIKVYEALGTFADDRVEMHENSAKVFSSSGNKFYDVIFDPETNSITANDNGSYWQGYLGYPSIVFLMKKGIIDFDKNVAEALKGIRWKDINVSFKNDFAKTEELILEKVEHKGFGVEFVKNEIKYILEQIKKLKLKKLPSKQKPPQGY